MNTIFDEVKNSLDMKTVASYYGYPPNRSGYVCCPFHSEKTPSMRLRENSFHCYGCDIKGGIIEFCMKLFNISNFEAVKKLNQDFALGLDIGKPSNYKPMNKPVVTKWQLLRYYQEWEKWAFRVLNDYYKLLKFWYEEFAPKTPDDTPYPLWVSACQKLPLIDHYCMILIEGCMEEKQRLFLNYRSEVERIAAECAKYYGE